MALVFPQKYTNPWSCPGGAAMNPPANAGDTGHAGVIPRSWRSLGGGNGNPLQYSCLGNLTDRGTWQATAHRVIKNQTPLSTEHNTDTHAYTPHAFQFAFKAPYDCISFPLTSGKSWDSSPSMWFPDTLVPSPDGGICGFPHMLCLMSMALSVFVPQTQFSLLPF